MTENIEIAIQLLIVGMLSVFIILGIVTGLARLLIALVNKYAPELPADAGHHKKSVDPKHVAVLSATVELITNGKGVIQSIKKI